MPHTSRLRISPVHSSPTFKIIESSGKGMHFASSILTSCANTWSRIVVSLYKIDAYLAIIRDQPPLLHREELDVSLTSTYSLWNAWGLDVFFKRLPHEPADRAGFKFSEVLSNPTSSARSLLLIEDIQLGFCGIALGVWNHTQRRRRGARPSAPSNTDSQASLSWQLECWKEELRKVSNVCIQSYLEEKTGEYPFRAYHGREGDNPAQRDLMAISQVKSLISESLTLYHLQGIQLYSDLKTFRSVAAHLANSMEDSSNPSPRIQRYQSQLQHWIGTPESRKALLHALSILETREKDVSNPSSEDGSSLNPIVHVATSASAMVIWAWVMFAEEACSCVPGHNHINIGVDPPDLQSTTQLENWIQVGGTVALQNTAVCRCFLDGWMARCAATLRDGDREWDLSYSIAPVLERFRQNGVSGPK